MKIRQENLDDADAIGIITSEAFENAYHSGGNEAQVVTGLRRAGALTISLVATDDADALMGHVAFSPVEINYQPGRWFALGPVSVCPNLQRCGIGSALIREGLARLKAMEAEGCVVAGEPTYYQRFGFIAGEALTYLGHTSPYLQSLVFKGSLPRGDVTFHAAFNLP